MRCIDIKKVALNVYFYIGNYHPFKCLEFRGHCCYICIYLVLNFSWGNFPFHSLHVSAFTLLICVGIGVYVCFIFQLRNTLNIFVIIPICILWFSKIVPIVNILRRKCRIIFVYVKFKRVTKILHSNKYSPPDVVS